MASEVLYHGSPVPLVGENLNPSQGEDAAERPENNLFAVYATDRKDLAIVMAIIACKDTEGGSIDEYQDGKLNARLYGQYPAQEFVYVHHLPTDEFTQTTIDKHQFFRTSAVKPLRTEIIRIKDYVHLIRLATEEETQENNRKYGRRLRD